MQAGRQIPEGSSIGDAGACVDNISPELVVVAHTDGVNWYALFRKQLPGIARPPMVPIRAPHDDQAARAALTWTRVHWLCPSCSIALQEVAIPALRQDETEILVWRRALVFANPLPEQVANAPRFPLSPDPHGITAAYACTKE